MKAKTKAKSAPTKKAKVNPIPKGMHSLTSYLIVKGAVEAIEYYKRAFGAKERFRMMGPDGKSVGHAELTIGDSILMLADESPCGGVSPKSLTGTSVSMVLYVKDVDTVFNRAVAAGATVKRPLQNMFYGDRAGGLQDPFGHVWTIMTHIEDVSKKEMNKRMAELCQQMAAKKEA